MPVITPKYGLTAFTTGEVYSASSDQRRFKIIDNQLAFLADIISDGVILGWDVQDDSSSAQLKLRITPGMGVISRYITRTFGNFVVDVSDNTTFYVYMQKKYNFIGGFSSFSNVASVNYVDTIAPNAPTNPQLTETLYNSVSILWNVSAAPDILQYLVQRSTDAINYTTIATVEDASYSDTSVSDNTLYYYRIIAEDLTGNQSASSVVLTIRTPADLRPPLDPSFLLVFYGDSQVELVWQTPKTGRVDHYELRVQELDERHELIGSIDTYQVNNSSTEFIVTGLQNDIGYQFTFYSVSSNGQYSPGLVRIVFPEFNIGPPEIADLVITDSRSTVNDSGIRVSLEWVPGIDPYRAFADIFIITLIENGDVVSDPIEVYNTNVLEIDLYPKNSLRRPILDRTDYIFFVQGRDSNGNTNNGVVGRILTRNFVAPASPKNLIDTTIPNIGILFTWENSADLFENNVITVTSENLSTGVITYIEQDTSFSNLQSFLIAQSDLLSNTRYSLSVYAVDGYGNNSDVVSTSTIHIIPDVPEEPTNKFAMSNCGSVTLIWRHRESRDASWYKIWRADFSVDGIKASSFHLVETVPGSHLSYTDYTTQVGSRYFYIMTAIDQYGQESPNPVDDDFFFYALVYGFGGTTPTFTAPENLEAVNTGVANDHDAYLSWGASDSTFDGYEIFRSNGNTYSWEKIGSVDNNTTTYIDQDGLLSTQIYYYLVRKFRNEAIPFLSTSPVPPISSIVLAKVIISLGSMSIDTDFRNDLALWRDPLLSFVHEILDIHTHGFVSTDNDRRIDVGKNVLLDNWSTLDNRAYTTEVDVPVASTYIAKIDGQLPNVLYEVNYYNKQVIFETAISGTELTLECVGTQETSGILPAERIYGVFGNQIEGDTFPVAQVPIFSHLGRVREELIPLQQNTESVDGFTYFLSQNLETTVTEPIGTSVSFYDVLNIQGSSTLIAATSWGLLSSTDGGSNWSILKILDGPPHTLYFAPISGNYFALTNGSVYLSNNGLNWVRTNKIEKSFFVRDIVEDPSQNIYISTNIGVFVLEPGDIGDYLDWRQSTVIDSESSSCYALWYDSTNNRVVVSTELGLFETSDIGIVWSYISDIVEEMIVYKFVEQDNRIFGLSNDVLWRKNVSDNNFNRVSELDCTMSRKMVIFDDRLCISTDTCLKISDISDNIYSASNICFTETVGVVNFSSMESDITGLSVTDDNFYIGTDEKIFGGTAFSSLALLYENLNGLIPTVYIDEQKQTVGFYYDTNNQLVTFDEIISENSLVTVANQYQIYRAKQGGWLGQNYTSPVKIYNKNIDYLTLSAPLDLTLVTSFNQVSLPVFTELNSNSRKASVYATLFNDEVAKYIAIVNGVESLPDDETLISIVRNIDRYYDMTFSQFLGKVNFISEIEYNDNDYTIFNFERVLDSLTTDILSDYTLVDNISSIEIGTSSTVQANVVDGVFKFSSSFDKYDIMSITIKRTTLYNDGSNSHNELDDTFEHINSGLDAAGLAVVGQSNIVRMGNTIEREWPGEQPTLRDACCGNVLLAPPHNAEFIIPRDNSWYDSLNSTVDYTERIDCGDLGLSIRYPNAVLYIQESGIVLVGSEDGLMSIQTSNLEMAEVDFSIENTTEAVKDIRRYDNTVFLLTARRLYSSLDYGISWSKEDLTGLTHSFVQFARIRDTNLIAAHDGVYYRNDRVSEWTRCFGFGTTPSLPADFNSDGIVDDADLTILVANWSPPGSTAGIDVPGDANGDGFVNDLDLNILLSSFGRVDSIPSSSPPVVLFFGPDLMFMLVSQRLFYTNDGILWYSGGSFGSIVVNDLDKYRSNIILATNSGLRNDQASFYSFDVNLAVIDLLNDITQSSAMKFNAIAVHEDNNRFVAGMGDGTVYLFIDGNYSTPAGVCESGLSCIHKIIFVGDDYWLFGYGKLKISSLVYSIKLSTGTPF